MAEIDYVRAVIIRDELNRLLMQNKNRTVVSLAALLIQTQWLEDSLKIAIRNLDAKLNEGQRVRFQRKEKKR